MAMLGKIAVNRGAIVNTNDVIAGSVPTGIITTKGPYGIVGRLSV